VRIAIIVGLMAGALAACSERKETAQAPATPAPAATAAGAERKAAVAEVPSPAGANAAEPFLFAGKNGVLLSWLEPVTGTDRTALRFSRFRNGAWDAPRTILERSDLFVNWADFPSIVEDAKGALFVHWLQKSGSATYAYDVWMAASTDDGATWGKPFLLNRDGKQSEHGFVSLAPLPGGGVGATWLDGRNMTMSADHDAKHDPGDMTIRYANVDATGKLTGDSQLDGRTCECCATGMAVTARGPVIAYRDRSPDEIRDIYFVSKDGHKFSEPRAIRADGWKINGCPVNGPQVDAMGNVAATAWYTAANGQQHVYAAFSGDGGATFGEAIVVDDGKGSGRVDVVMLDENTALVTWLEQTATGGEIRAKRVSRAGTAASSAKIADASTSRAAGFARIARAGEDVWVTWTETDGKNKKIHVARGPL